MSRSGSRKSIPNESELLAFIEGELSESDTSDLLGRLEGQSKALRGLENLRADKERLSQLEIPELPDDLIDDCLAAVERSFLVDDDPIAPVLTVPGRRKSRWRRFAAAAVFFGLATVGGYWILRSVDLEPSAPEFAANRSEIEAPGGTEKANEASSDTLAADSDSGLSSAATDASDRNDALPTQDPETTPGGPAPELVPLEKQETAERVARLFEIPPLLDDTPIVRGTDESTEARPSADRPDINSVDLGLGVRLASLDRDPMLERLRQLVNEQRGVTLVYNTPLRDTVPSDVDFEISGPSNISSAGGDGDRNRIDWSDRSDLQADQNEAVDDASDFATLPIELQQAYRTEGFEYTLIGTPSELHAILRNMNSGPERIAQVRYLVRIEREDGAADYQTLADLLPPSRPEGKDWSRAIFWWTAPERNRPIAEQLVEAWRPEPTVRIPLRLIGR